MSSFIIAVDERMAEQLLIVESYCEGRARIPGIMLDYIQLTFPHLVTKYSWLF